MKMNEETLKRTPEWPKRRRFRRAFFFWSFRGENGGIFFVFIDFFFGELANESGHFRSVMARSAHGKAAESNLFFCGACFNYRQTTATKQQRIETNKTFFRSVVRWRWRRSRRRRKSPKEIRPERAKRERWTLKSISWCACKDHILMQFWVIWSTWNFTKKYDSFLVKLGEIYLDSRHDTINLLRRGKINIFWLFATGLWTKLNS